MTDQSLEPIKFYRKSEAFGVFSNFSPHYIPIHGFIAATSEHLFQAAKFVRTDPGHAKDILAITDPAVAAKMGRDRDHPLDSSWNQSIGIRLFDTDLTSKDVVMVYVVYTKFHDHDGAGTILKDTGNRQIIEHTVNDSYWGDGGDGSGKNMLGQILEYVRNLLITGEFLPIDVYRITSDLFVGLID